MGPHRGSTIYIPIIIPENWQIACSVACAVVAVVLLSLSLTGAGGGFETWTLTVPPTEDNIPYGNAFELQVSLQWGLRYLHVSYCRTHSTTQAIVADKQFCGSDDVEYSMCSVENTWCNSSPDPWPTYVLMIGSIIGLVVSTLVSLSRRVYQPAGYSLCTIACCVAIVLWRIALAGFEPSETLFIWMQRATEQSGGKAVRSTGTSYWILTAAFVVLFTGLMLASWGAVRARRADAERAVDTAVVEDAHNAPAPAVLASAAGPNSAPPTSRPPAMRERDGLHSPSSRIPPPPPSSRAAAPTTTQEDGGDMALEPIPSKSNNNTATTTTHHPTSRRNNSAAVQSSSSKVIVDFAEGNQ